VFPDWLKSSSQVPIAVKLTEAPPEIVHTELVEGSTVIDTGRPEKALADGV
jgi:hypothetical protein